MLQTLAIYIPLWASCLLICLGATLMLVVRLGGITADARPLLFRVSSLSCLLFLLATRQWLFAIASVVFMWSEPFRNLLNDSTDTALKEAYWWLLVAGILGLLDASNWVPLVMAPLSHPIISIGLALGILVTLARSALISGNRA